MTLTTPFSYIDYKGDGVTLQFVIPFPFLDLPQHIAVYDIDLGFEGKVEYIQGVDYSIVGIPLSPKVQFVVAPPSGKAIHIRRTVPITQELDYLETGKFPAESHEKGLDKLTMICQQLSDILILGDIQFGDFMKKGPHPDENPVTVAWKGQSLEIVQLLEGKEANSAVTLSQLQAAVSGGVPATLSGQTALYFSGNNVTTTFTLTGIQDIDADDINVYINGVHQSAHPGTGAYTVNNAGNPLTDTTMTFQTAPPSGTNNIMVVFPSGAVSVTVGANSVNSAAIIDGSVGVAELAPGSVVGQVIIWTGATWTYSTLSSANITNFAAAVQATKLNQFAAPTGPVNLGNQRINNLQAGAANTDAANVGQLVGHKRSISGTVSSTWWTPPGVTIPCNFIPGMVTFTFNFGYGAGAAGDNAGSIGVAIVTDRVWRVMYIAQDPDGGLDEERFIPVSFIRAGSNLTIIGDPGTVVNFNPGVGHYFITEA